MTSIDPRLSPQLSALAPQLTALRCAFLLAAHHGAHLAPEDLPDVAEGSMIPSVVRSLDAAGFRVKALSRCRWKTAAGLGSAYPALAVMHDGRWIVLIQTMVHGGAECAAILDPQNEAQASISCRARTSRPRGPARCCSRDGPPRSPPKPQPFGLRWFIPELLRQRRLLGGVALAAVVANLIAFSIPLLMQVLIDRVIAHQAWNTLTVVVVRLRGARELRRGVLLRPPAPDAGGRRQGRRAAGGEGVRAPAVAAAVEVRDHGDRRADAAHAADREAPPVPHRPAVPDAARRGPAAGAAHACSCCIRRC